MPITYLKNPDAKKKPCECNLCGTRVLWVVVKEGRFYRNIPIEYDPDLEKWLFDGMSKVYFEPKIMKRHWDNCRRKKILQKG